MDNTEDDDLTTEAFRVVCTQYEELRKALGIPQRLVVRKKIRKLFKKNMLALHSDKNAADPIKEHMVSVNGAVQTHRQISICPLHTLSSTYIYKH